MSMRVYDEITVRRTLKAHCVNIGGVRAFASQHRISEVFVEDVIAGNRAPSEMICRRLGFQSVTRYVKVRKKRQRR